jgi:hypothetical protein
MIAGSAPKVGICVIYEDTNLDSVNKLQTVLKPLVKQDFVEEIRLQSINNSADWSDLTANGLFLLILLLLSPDLLVSEHFADEKMQYVLDMHNAKKARLIPILLRPCEWRTSPFRRLQPLPQNGVPISLWKNQKQAYFDVFTSIREVITEFLVTSSSAQSSDADPCL